MKSPNFQWLGTKAKNKKGEEQDFETFVRVTLGSLQESVNAIKSAQDEMLSELNSLKGRVSSNDALLLGISKKQDSLTKKFEKVNGEFRDINCKIEKIEQDMEKKVLASNSLYEQLLALERYFRGFNLRFYKIPEHTDEDCIDILEKIFSSDLNLKPVIENALRIGPFRDDGSPHLIIAKFLYRSERRDILRKKKHFKNGISTSRRIGKRKTT